MTGIFEPRKDILLPAQARLWPQLRPASGLGFVLYGGTAIALRLGHRQSVDFDFFRERGLDRSELERAFPFLASSLVLQDEPDALSVLVRQGEESETVKVSFFGNICFGRLGEPDMTSDGVLEVASLDDLMATKVKVILQRVESKDYRDVAAMMGNGADLAAALAGARRLYGNAFQPSESLKALVYFEGGDLDMLSVADRRALMDAASKVRDLPEAALVSHSISGGRRAPG